MSKDLLEEYLVERHIDNPRVEHSFRDKLAHDP
jgi:hypothetical protein